MKKILLSLVCAAALAPTYSSSAAAPVCNLINDPTGDVLAGGQKVSDDNVDLVSADIAADSKVVVAVIRVAKLSSWDQLSGPLGNRTYLLSFAAAPRESVRFFKVTGFSVTDGAAPNYDFVYGHVNSSGQSVIDGTAVGSYDLAAGTIKMSAPTNGWAKAKLATITKRRVLSSLSATAQVHFVNGDSYGPEPANTRQLNPLRPTDTAASASKYVVGTASCVATT